MCGLGEQTITILHILREGPLRTGAIQSAITEVSPKVLTQTLCGMERDGLVHRDIYKVAPPRVEYSLTPMGKSLIKPQQDFCHWAKAHAQDRDSARSRYDSEVTLPLEPVGFAAKRKTR